MHFLKIDHFIWKFPCCLFITKLQKMKCRWAFHHCVISSKCKITKGVFKKKHVFKNALKIILNAPFLENIFFLLSHSSFTLYSTLVGTIDVQTIGFVCLLEIFFSFICGGEGPINFEKKNVWKWFFTVNWHSENFLLCKINLKNNRN